MNNKLVVLLVLLLLAIIGGAFYLKMDKGTGPDPMKGDASEKPKEVTKTEVPVDKAPEKFPSDMPIEAGSAILQNYNATAPDGRFQATRVFETKESLATNLTIYRNYLTKSGYEIKSTIDQPNYKMVYGTKGNASIQVSIDQNTVSNIKTVSISYTEQPEQPSQSPSTNASTPPAQSR
jgi:hypothetical protein